MKEMIDEFIRKVDSMGESYECLKKSMQEYMAMSQSYRDYIQKHYSDAHFEAIKHIMEGE